MYLGIDIGSVSTNAVVLNQKGEIMGYSILPSGYNHKQTVADIIQMICKNARIQKDEINKIVGTGYGRENINGTCKTVTEITCHAVGVRYLYKDADIIIDIGGQDSKVTRLSKEGYVERFSMNDKCSAGTGRFLEVMAGIMNMDMDEFSVCGLKAKNVYKISSTCTVFAESEIISGISKGVRREEIIAGIYHSIVNRILALAGDLNESDSVVLTGGVAKNQGVVEYMRKMLPNIKVPEEPQITGALGAALMAYYD